MKILVVEDQPLELKLAVDVLTAAGHEVEKASAAEPAFASIGKVSPDIILLDVALPGMDGFSLARELKSNPATRDIPIVAVTSYPEQFTPADAIAAGCDAYLTKPWSTRTLPELLTDIVENAEGRRDP